MYITDPGNASHKAHVSPSGALSVGGTVTTSAGLPGSPFSKTGVGPPSITVPAGKHLVIQTVAVNVDVTSGNTIVASLTYVTGGTSVTIDIPVTYEYTASGYDTYVAIQNLSIYADPGSTVYESVSSPSGGTTGTDFLTVSGYLF